MDPTSALLAITVCCGAIAVWLLARGPERRSAPDTADAERIVDMAPERDEVRMPPPTMAPVPSRTGLLEEDPTQPMTHLPSVFPDSQSFSPTEPAGDLAQTRPYAATEPLPLNAR